MPQNTQLNLNRELTARDIVGLTMQECAKRTARLGNPAMAVICGSQKAMDALKRLDAVALTGDVEATRVAGRRCIREIEALLAAGMGEG